MPVATIVQLILQVGLPLTQELIALWGKNANVSADDFAALVAKTQVSAKQVMTNQLNAAGIPLTSPQAVALLAQVG